MFCFPKCKVPQCIIEINVEWKHFHIFTKLKRFPKLEDGLGRLKEVIKAQKERHPQIRAPFNKAVMTLSDDDLKIFGTGFMQIDSPSHIIVTDKKNVVKLLYDSGEMRSIEAIIKLDLGLNECPLGVPSFFAPFAYSYKYFPHAPLKWREAKSCLRGLVVGVNTVLTTLHSQNVCHNDLKLDNICFDEQFTPCLIDFDRSSSERVAPRFYNYVGSSCMYDVFNPVVKDKARDADADYMQLGWMVAWLFVDEPLDYHRREWEPTDSEENITCAPPKVRQNKFIIEKRQFDESLLSCLPEDVSTLKDVLEARAR